MVVRTTPFGTALTDDRATLPSEVEPITDFLSPIYRIVAKLGSGGYGAVFEIVDCDYQTLALKVQKVSTKGPPKLKKEFDIYRKLLLNSKQRFLTPGITCAYSYTEHEGLEYMIMDKLGDSLDQILDKSERKQLTIRDVLMIGIQAIRRLRALHENGILHRDVKPNNLVMGHTGSDERTVHIIDMGLATTVEAWSSYDYGKDVGFAGTLYYASTEALLHKAPTRKGDMESLAYTLLYLAFGKLPWISTDPETGRRFRDSELGMQRLQYDSEELCEGCEELTGFVEAVSSSKRTEKPEYERLIILLEMEVYKLGGDDGRFNWLEPSADATYASFVPSQKQRKPPYKLQEALWAADENESKSVPSRPPGFC